MVPILLEIIGCGYIIGFSCLLCLLTRVYFASSKREALGRPLETLLGGMKILRSLLISTSIAVIWTMVGIAVHFFYSQNEQFIQISFLVALSCLLELVLTKMIKKSIRILNTIFNSPIGQGL